MSLAKISARFPAIKKSEVQIKDYPTWRLNSSDELIPLAQELKSHGYDYLETITAVDWLGPVSPQGYIRDANPNVFLPEGATPQVQATATPGVKYRPIFDLLWVFGNIKEKAKLLIRLEMPRDSAVVPSLTGLFKAADWQERETFDLLGIRFSGHPNLVKILTPDFTIGHPLRKDYAHIKDRYDD